MVTATKRTMRMFLIAIMTLFQIIEANVFDVQELNQAKCEGSLNIIDKNGKRHSFTSSEDDLKLTIMEAAVHGCGCFRMYKFKKGRGRSVFIAGGDILTNDEFFTNIRSIRKIPCHV